jgi:hypothetical protein
MPWGIDVTGLAARGGRVFASEWRGVYELSDGQAHKLPLRFEPLGRVRVSYDLRGLVVLEVTPPSPSGGRKLIAALDKD